ncbi:VWA domain-containing protein [Haloechinothrix sp. YIM 98757]|uniref:VWA domain-containing protein n=1 Tax=Haloechinothrix aidingensis TaxID=2752311 RepID=A0A838AAS6_9PSEU|nr:VWA domain-containing protein [Haloechinothrix aidingensis]MBA0126350.1 VWA domain-containing protein [Haloechinothrix aidingensis]
MEQPHFDVEVAQNRYLPRGADTVDAIVTVTAHPPAQELRPSVAVVILLDCSASMYRPSKLAAAKRAAHAAIDSLRDGAGFAIVAGTHEATMIYPESSELAVAGEATRYEAKRAVDEISAGGGTAMSRWLRAAGALFAGSRYELRHAILLTDGRNTSEQPEAVSAALTELQDTFRCDCRGVGTDWLVSELRQISEALLGTVDIVAEPDELVTDFAAMIERAMRKSVPDVTLRLWTPKEAAVTAVRQVDPAVLDLTAHQENAQAQACDYATGAWEFETRAFQVRIAVPSAGVGDTMLACRVSVVDAAGEVLGRGKVLATWTDDPAYYGALDPQVAHYTGQVELATAIQHGLDARRSGDLDTATHKLGRAVALAAQSEHAETMKLLSKVVDVEEAETGRVRLKDTVDELDHMTLDTRSVVTTRRHGRS